MKYLLILLLAISVSSIRADSTCGQMAVNAASHTANGYVKQGCHGLTFICGSGATCAVAGATLPANTIVTVPIPSCATSGDVYYTVSGGTLWSLEVR
jgi:hypothetical protein